MLTIKVLKINIDKLEDDIRVHKFTIMERQSKHESEMRVRGDIIKQRDTKIEKQRKKWLERGAERLGLLIKAGMLMHCFRGMAEVHRDKLEEVKSVMS